MKLRIIIGALLALTVGGVSAALADHGCDCRPCCSEEQGGRGPGKWEGMHDGRGRERIGKALGLTETQQKKIDGIVQAEWDKIAPLRQKLEDSLKQLRQAEQTAKFDETAVRAIATNQAQIITEMSVSHARTRSQIHALLTPEQRARADKLRPPMGDGGPGLFPPPMESRSPREMRHRDCD